MKSHVLKCLPEYFQAIKRGEKTFEIRKGLDRVYEVGDQVVLQEFSPETKETGERLRLEITYVMRGGLWLPPDTWVFSFVISKRW